MDPAIQKVHYLDLQKGFIAKRGARALGVSKNYYSTSVEKYLSCNYETPIAKVIGRLLPLINGDVDKVTLT